MISSISDYFVVGCLHFLFLGQCVERLYLTVWQGIPEEHAICVEPLLHKRLHLYVTRRIVPDIPQHRWHYHSCGNVDQWQGAEEDGGDAGKTFTTYTWDDNCICY